MKNHCQLILNNRIILNLVVTKKFHLISVHRNQWECPIIKCRQSFFSKKNFYFIHVRKFWFPRYQSSNLVKFTSFRKKFLTVKLSRPDFFRNKIKITTAAYTT